MRHTEMKWQDFNIRNFRRVFIYRYLTIRLVITILYKMSSGKNRSVFELYLSDIDKIPDITNEELNKIVVEAKKNPNYLTANIIRACLKILKKFAPKICRGFYEYLGDLINDWLLNKLPGYVKNYDPEKGDFRYYIQAHLRKELYSDFIEIVRKNEVQMKKIAYKIGEEDYILKTLEIKRKLDEIKKKWDKLKWNSSINKTLYCSIYSFYPDFIKSSDNMYKFKECFKNPGICFDKFILTAITQRNSKILNDYSKMCGVLNHILEEGYPANQDKKWNKELLTDRKRNLKNWLQKKLRLK